MFNLDKDLARLQQENVSLERNLDLAHSNAAGWRALSYVLLLFLLMSCGLNIFLIWG